MFGTLKTGKKNNAGTMVFVEQNKQGRGAPGSPHSACKICRDRKLKCTGEATGCKRCKSSNVRCEYPNPSEDKRGSKSRMSQASAAAIGRQTPPASSSAASATNAPGPPPQGNEQPPSENAANSCLDPDGPLVDMDFPLSSFPATSLPGGFHDDLTGIDPWLLENIEEQTKCFDVDNLNYFQQPFEFDPLADLALPPIDLSQYANSSSDSDTSLENSTDPSFMDLFLSPQIQWHPRDGSFSHQDSMSISSKGTSKSGSHMSRGSMAASKPASSLAQDRSPFTATLQPHSQNKRVAPDSSSGSDSDSSGRQCRCSDRALRLLEKLPNLADSSTSSPSAGCPSESSSPERMDISFPPEMQARTANTSMTRAHFVQAASLFLGHFSRYLAVFSTISQCQTCLRNSSFSMILLMLAQRLTSRVSLLLQKYAPSPGKESSSQKLVLTIAESAIVYEDALPLVSTLLAGKVCRLASCIGRIKGVCLRSRWGSYAKGFDALETPLKERMAELEAMM
ncbi:hypothetical protein F5Y17DRAFT_116851 [Xylariaceae sp. FL0594]|nr:hypothetical protein F5Y17DRAFT_116851 [Xylariaceae sp. FL0594]